MEGYTFLVSQEEDLLDLSVDRALPGLLHEELEPAPLLLAGDLL
jgi:hypothetical protein